MVKIRYKLIDKSDYVSFDIFDTLVKRILLTSENVYKVVAHIYKDRYGEALGGFEGERKKAEYVLWGQTDKGRFTLDEIYLYLAERYGIKKCARLKEIEIEVESTVIRLNSYIYPLYRYARDRKKILITSDMYLGRPFMLDILDREGIDSYEKVYISGEDKRSKANGNLFKMIRSEFPGKKIVHIGDAIKGDYLKPRCNKIQSLWIASYKQSYFCDRKDLSIVDSLVVGLSDTRALIKERFWENFGYSVLGPVLLGFIEWINESALKEGVDQIVFLARDGFLVKSAFDLFFTDRDGLDTEYMYVSRKSVLPALIDEDPKLQEILRLIKFRKKETMKTVLLRLGIDDEKANLYDGITVSRDDLYAGRYDDAIMPFFKEIKDNILEQKKHISDYEKDILVGKKIAIVDVGWHGTIQNCLCRLSTKNIVGLYLGLEEKSDGLKKPFLTNLDPNIIPYTRGVFETCFSALHPSTKGYVNINGKVVPVFDTCIYSEKTKIKISKMQRGALDFVSDFKIFSRRLSIDDTKIDHRLVSDMFIKFCVNPKKMDAVQFGNIEFNDITNRRLINFKKGKFLSNIVSFFDSDWKAGYLRSIYGEMFRYGEILAFLNRFRKKR